MCLLNNDDQIELEGNKEILFILEKKKRKNLRVNNEIPSNQVV